MLLHTERMKKLGHNFRKCHANLAYSLIKQTLIKTFLLFNVFTIGCATRLPYENEVANSPHSILLDKKYFKVSFNPKYSLANWVVYTLKADNLKNKVAKRSNHFFEDKELSWRGIASITSDKYKRTLYDKGHLAPSGDFLYSQIANDSTFVMTNIVPQTRNLNRQSWRYLEERIRGWACSEGELKIIVGPILSDKDLVTKSDLIVPARFFKIVLDETPPRKSIAFIYYQSDVGDVYAERVADLDVIQKQINTSNLGDYLNLPIENYPPAGSANWKTASCL